VQGCALDHDEELLRMRGRNGLFNPLLLATVVLAAWSLPGLADVAQQPAASAAKPHVRPAIGTITLEDQVARFSKSLNLSETQQSQLKRILEYRQAETRRIREDDSIAGEERIGRIRELQDGTVARIRAILDEEQRKKYDPLVVRQAQRSSPQTSVDEWMQAVRKQ
jgi:periplasmic protein CpxP/Spy